MPVNDPRSEILTAIPSLSPSGDASAEDRTFRWQALFQRGTDPVFVLDRRRRILFVSRAWEALTGMTASEARGLTCARRAPLPQDPPDLIVRALCCPTPEVLKGVASRVHRLFLAPAENPRWCSIDFLPIRREDKVLFIVGRIGAVSKSAANQSIPLPEKLVSLRQRLRLRHGLDSLVSTLPVFRRVIEQVRLACQSRVPALLVGEAGTGKTWIARTIHCLSSNMEDGFAIIDCNRLPAKLAADFLFSDRAIGSQSGARSIYLRNPSSLPLDIQSQLAQWLQENALDGVRILVGCDVAPEVESRAGRLHEELLTSISTLRINLPALRERLADLPLLVDAMLMRINSARQRPVTALTQEAWEYFRAYTWPGNLTELFAVLKGSSARCQTDQIDAALLPNSIRFAVGIQDHPALPAEKKISLDKILQEAERRLILAALRKAGGNRTKAADLLSIWRPRLLRRMEALGIVQD